MPRQTIPSLLSAMGVATALLAPAAAPAQHWRNGVDARETPHPVRDYGDEVRSPGGYGADRVHRGARPTPRLSSCDRGTGGTILGAIAGGLLGNGMAGRGDRGGGTVVGAGVGALAGRAIDRTC